MPILSWLIRGLLFLAAIITGWFVAEDAPNFSVIQMVVAVFLLTIFVGLAAFWETVMDWIRERRQRS